MRDSEQYADLLLWFMCVQRCVARLFSSAVSEAFQVPLTETRQWLRYSKR